MSALVTLAGLDVLDAYIVFPRSGVWTMNAELDADTAPEGRVALIIAGDGAPTVGFSGVVARRAYPSGRARVVVVGGVSGGFSSEPSLAVDVPATHYDGQPVDVGARELLEDLCALVGEQLQPSAAALLDGFAASSWHRVAGTARAALAPITRRWGLSARFQPTGELWVGVETWPDAPETPQQVDPLADERILYTAPRSARIQPGQRVYGEQIERVDYLVTPRGLRAWIHYGERPS